MLVVVGISSASLIIQYLFQASLREGDLTEFVNEEDAILLQEISQLRGEVW